jgi:hypothetical protein
MDLGGAPLAVVDLDRLTLSAGVFDALDSETAVLEADGTIIAVNQAWDRSDARTVPSARPSEPTTSGSVSRPGNRTPGRSWRGSERSRTGGSRPSGTSTHATRHARSAGGAWR